ncbi:MULTISPECIES: helix-turn-helix domain-containing protein [Acinetobacter calcoaceticus/baumannii complex]|uniref:helix-turn-helix domain-containing protein n=1 Tax=Acinetobacter calcoaceticus/baumannii complex TaxID=909768 RepID=UPI00124F97B0|nr:MULTISPECIES: helix-turn-helix transcriptional regulator [Acinetobacter calcoaceticus/baumannii complex]MDH2662897.1 helix-turn-helix transcriptional regulator [Acinetobacter baumannii]
MKDSFGARLKFFRSKAGLSQQQLADKTGLSRKIISDYEVKLDVIPRDSNLYKIADALGVDSSNLIPKTRGDATEQPDGNFSITYNINEFPRKIVEFLENEAQKNNRSIQEQFEVFMSGVVDKFINMSENERNSKLDNQQNSKLELDEKAFEEHLGNSNHI